MTGTKTCALGRAIALVGILLTGFVSVSRVSSQTIGNGAVVSGLTAGAALRDPFAALNPSTAGSNREAAVSIWTTRPYNISEIQIVGFTGTLSLWGLGIAPRFRSIGFDDYREYQSSIQLGIPITWGADRNTNQGTDRLARMGIGVHAVSKSAAQGGLRTSYVLTTGILVPVAPNIELGAVLSRSIKNTTRGVRKMLVGLSFRLHEKTSIYLDVFSETLFRPSYRLGMFTRPVRPIALRMGASTNPDKLSIGLSVRAGPLTGSIAVEYHLLLGATTTIETTISSFDS